MANKKNEVKKVIKNTHKLTLFFTLLFLVIGAVGGFFSYNFLTKNDTFELIGENQIEIALNSSDYVEQGVKIIAFGKDISDQVIIDGEVNARVVGEYVLTYTINNFKYKNVKKIRVVNIVESVAEEANHE